METHPRPETADQMKGLVQLSDRGPVDLVLRNDLLRPTPGPGQYLVRVGAAGINFADAMQTRGTYGDGPRPPYVAGFEAAGEVVAVGSDIADAKPIGTHVIGTGAGAFAEHVLVSATDALPVPAGWSDAEALGMVLNWVTALAALRPMGDLQAGEAVLVHAAAGGVGQAAVRIARHLGARIVAAASPDKHAILKSLGADVIIDGRRADLAEEVMRQTGGVDLVLESVGRATFAASLAVTRPVVGRVVVFGAASGEATIRTDDLIFRHPVRVAGLNVGVLAQRAPAVFTDLVAQIQTLIDLGVYPPGTPQVHSLSEGPDVLMRLESGSTQGKHALDPWR